MVNFTMVEPASQIIILIITLFTLLTHGHIMAFTTVRIGRWKIGLIAFIQILLSYATLVGLSTYLYEIELERNLHPISYFFATLPLWIYHVILVMGNCLNFILLYRIKMYKQNIITRGSIKESVDNLPAGLCLSQENSFVVLSNWQIDRLCHILTGKDLRNSEDFWQDLTKKRLKKGNKSWTRTGNPIITLADGGTWSFGKRIIEVEGQSIIEITAFDTTDLNSLRIQLEKDNEALLEMGSRLKKYSKNVMEIKAKEERLAAKIHIHDELGYALMATRQLLQNQESNEEIEIEAKEILNLWKKNISVLKGVRELRKSTVLESLISAAQAVGIKIILKGNFPKKSEIVNLILQFAGECLTNAVNHASATELYLEIIEANRGYIVEFSNNGIVPREKIVEGGGLSGLRDKIESVGGEMEINHVPKFVLKAIIPKEGGEDNDSSFNCRK